MSKKNNNKVKFKTERVIELIGLEEELELDSVKQAKAEGDREFIYLDKMDNGKWRLSCSKGAIKNIKKFEGIRISEIESFDYD